MVDNSISSNQESIRHYPSRRGSKGRAIPAKVRKSSQPQEVIRDLPANNEESAVSQRRWISPRTTASNRLSAVVAEAKRKEKEEQANAKTDVPMESSTSVSPDDDLIDGASSAETVADLEKPVDTDQDLSAAPAVLANLPGKEKTEKPLFGDTPPVTITDTQSALTATQVKAEIRRQKKKRRRRRNLILALVLVLIFAIGGGGFYAGIKYSPEFASIFGINRDYQGKGHGEILITIPQGATGRQIGEILFKNDVIASVDGFVVAYNKNKYAQGIQVGTYKMAKQMSTEEALSRLLDPKYKADEKLTVPEGFKVSQIKQRFNKVAGFKTEQVEAAFETAAKEYLPKEAKGKLEGWIAPDTYVLQIGDTPEKLLKKMIDRQKERLQKLGVAADQYETVLIKASILEREVGNNENMGKVARVIDNRLKKDGETDGLLQMCSTVSYGLDKDIIIPTDEELKKDTPYNTYIHPGLPPSPIGSPGEDALKATLNPTPGDWIYFATVNLETGETRFAKTKEEHDKNVLELRKYCDNHPKICKKQD